MPNTNIVGGTWATNGAPLVPGSGSIPFNGGSYYYVCNRTGANGSDGNEGTADMPFATLAFAISKCVADQGDVIVILSGHAENVASAAAIAANVAGITIIGEGNGSDRPTFTFITSTAATWTVSAANVTIANVVGVCGIDVLVSPWVVSAAGCTLGLPGAPIEWQDPSSSFQAVRQILTTAAADKLTINLKTIGVISGGTSPVNAIRLIGCNAGWINVDFYGRASTAVVEFFTGAASTDIEVYGYMYNSGVTDYTKDIVDTVTGTTWFASFNDGAAGYAISGGSGSALGPAQAATVIADLSVATVDGTANTLERDVIGNKTDAAVTAVGTTKSIEAYVKGLVTMNTVIAADSANNAFAGSVIGNKTDASVQAISATASIAGYVKGLTDAISGTAGLATFPAAAAAANAVSLAEVIRYISELQVPRVAIKIIATASSALTTGLSPVTLFTVTGDVMVRVWATVQTGLTSTATTGTLEVGVSGNTAGLLPQVVANGTNFPTGAVWVDVTPTLKMEAFTAANTNWAPIAGSANITCVVATNSMTAGAITFYCQYLPVSSGASVVAA